MSFDVYLAYDIENFVAQVIWFAMLGIQAFATR